MWQKEDMLYFDSLAKALVVDVSGSCCKNAHVILCNKGVTHFRSLTNLYRLDQSSRDILLIQWHRKTEKINFKKILLYLFYRHTLIIYRKKQNTVKCKSSKLLIIYGHINVFSKSHVLNNGFLLFKSKTTMRENYQKSGFRKHILSLRYQLVTSRSSVSASPNRELFPSSPISSSFQGIPSLLRISGKFALRNATICLLISANSKRNAS